MLIQAPTELTLSDHVYEPKLVIGSHSELRFFMENHVYAVWDFMSLLKYLQDTVAPTNVPWHPPKDPVAARLINEIVLDEESDSHALPAASNAGPSSHFELYLLAMQEVGADIGPVTEFIDLVRGRGVNQAIAKAEIPIAAKRFMQFTFSVIHWDEPHLVAAAFCVGREEWLPGHFQNLLAEIGVREDDAPAFHTYLRRHVDLDSNDHGPAAKQLLATLCDGDPVKTAGAKKIARDSIKARQNLLQDIRIGMASLAPCNLPVRGRVGAGLSGQV